MAETSKSAATAAPSSDASAPAVDPLLGRTINDRFRILGVIARGGMGKVYRAEQAPLGRICAVKVLNPNYAGENDPEFHKRFFMEASIASKLKHPNTVTIFDYGRTDDDVYYMAMELLEGRTLHRLIREEGPLAPMRALHIARQISRSLREAHGLGVIHRDLKPANVFLIQHDDEADFVKVLDFGLVKQLEESAEPITQTGLFMGSPKYMAPEQIRGERVTARTDIYALGVVMFEMLTGKVPFDRGNSVNTLMAHVSDPVPALHEFAPHVQIPPQLEEIVYRALAKRPDDRYASMDELIAAVKHAAGEIGGPTGEFSSTSLSIPSGEISLQAVRPILPSDSPPTGASGPMVIEGPSVSARIPSGPEPTISASRARPRRIGLVIGLSVALLAVAAGAVGLWRMSTPSAPTASGHAVTPPTANPPASSAVVHVSLTSDPANAEVLDGTTSIGHTPLQLDWSGAQGDPARAHAFTFRLANYRDETVTLSGPSITYRATLQPLPPITATTTTTTNPPANANAHPRPARPTRPSRPNTRPPPGYRDIDW